MGLITTRQLCVKTGATYRQLDYWTRQDIVPCEGKACPGTGNTRYYDEDLEKVVRLLATISKAFQGNPPGVIMKQIVENYDVGFILLSEHVTINWEPE